jgi:hypothetical protein
VFPVGYELKYYRLFRRNFVFERLKRLRRDSMLILKPKKLFFIHRVKKGEGYKTFAETGGGSIIRRLKTSVLIILITEK